MHSVVIENLRIDSKSNGEEKKSKSNLYNSEQNINKRALTHTRIKTNKKD